MVHTLQSTTLASLQSDKYAAFSKLDKVKGSKGWSGKITTSQMIGNPMGWSDEVLGVSTDEDELQDFELERRPIHLEVEEPWANPLHRSSWDRSPNRSFVRNFP